MKCPNCGFSFNAGTTCPSCGDNSLELEKKRKLQEQEDILLEEQRKIERQKILDMTGSPKPGMTCGKCGYEYNAGKTCPSCGHSDLEIDPDQDSGKTQTYAADRSKTSMTCRKCGLRYDSGETCPSCGHTNIDPAAQRLTPANRSNPIETPKPEVLCNKCGFRFNSGKTCPSCGHTNSNKDPEYRARQNPKNYVYRPIPKTWVLVMSIIGIIYSGISSLLSVLLMYLGSKGGLIFSVLGAFLLVFSLLDIFLFINLLRMKKWAVWAMRILQTLTIVLLAVQGQFLSLQFFFAVFWCAVFWFADWSDFS